CRAPGFQVTSAKTLRPRQRSTRKRKAKIMRLPFKCSWSVLVLVIASPWSLGGDGTLESRLAPLAKSHQGKVAIAVQHLRTGEGYFLNTDEPMTTASLI